MAVDESANINVTSLVFSRIHERRVVITDDGSGTVLTERASFKLLPQRETKLFIAHSKMVPPTISLLESSQLVKQGAEAVRQVLYTVFSYLT